MIDIDWTNFNTNPNTYFKKTPEMSEIEIPLKKIIEKFNTLLNIEQLCVIFLLNQDVYSYSDKDILLQHISLNHSEKVNEFLTWMFTFFTTLIHRYLKKSYAKIMKEKISWIFDKLIIFNAHEAEYKQQSIRITYLIIFWILMIEIFLFKNADPKTMKKYKLFAYHLGNYFNYEQRFINENFQNNIEINWVHGNKDLVKKFFQNLPEPLYVHNQEDWNHYNENNIIICYLNDDLIHNNFQLTMIRSIKENDTLILNSKVLLIDKIYIVHYSRTPNQVIQPQHNLNIEANSIFYFEFA